MNSFSPQLATPSASAADPSKHVNYTYGMVLGVDDFTQEFAYLAGRDRWLARDCLGYGTVAGLAVSVEQNAGTGDTEVIVTAGTAVSPRGQLIKVTPTQCASLNKWLANTTNAQAVKDKLSLPPAGPLRLYVVLCYRECATDTVPIPGEPCRSEDASTAPSRLQDDFTLELRFAPPAQEEEEAIRAFVAWLKEHVEISDGPGPFTTLDDFIAAIRRAVVEPSSPPSSPPDSPPSSPPDFLLDSPLTVMQVQASEACEYLRAAFRLWTTELRPLWRPASFDPAGCAASTSIAQAQAFDDSLLLAELVLTLNADGSLNTGVAVEIDEERRPFMLSLRMVQEWLLCARCCAAATVGSPIISSPVALVIESAHTFATLYLKSPTVVRAWLHHPVLLDVPAASVTLDAGETTTPVNPQPVSVAPIAPGLNVFDLQLSAPLTPASRLAVGFDAAQIMEEPAGANPARPLLAALGTHTSTYALDSDGHTLSAYLGVSARALKDLTDVAVNAPQNNQVLTFKAGSWVAANLPAGGATGPAGGDLAGNYPNPAVAGLRGRAVNAAAPSANQVLTWDGAQWSPANVPAVNAIKPGDAAGGDLSATYPNPTVARIQTRAVSNAAPNAGQVLTWSGTQWAPNNLPVPPAAIKPGDAAGGDLAGTYPNPTVAKLQTRAVSNSAPAAGQALAWDGTQWTPTDLPAIKPGDKAGGDLSGTYPDPTVNRIQTRQVSNAPPNDGDVLTWNNAQSLWTPKALPAPPPPQKVLNLLPFATLFTTTATPNGVNFTFWINIEAPENQAAIVPPPGQKVFPPNSVRVFAETNAAPFLNQQNVGSIIPTGTRNLLNVALAQPLTTTTLLRFLFDLRLLNVHVEGTAVDIDAQTYLTKFGMNFAACDGARVTIFVPFIVKG
jgi:hypothetical protein